MTQSSRGSDRTEVSDLRNIVERLDLLMGSSPSAAAQPAPLSSVGDMVTDLTDRLGMLESEVSELRTLVNHLMTIATWQAKVTATLVGEEADVDGDEGSAGTARDERRPRAPGGQASGERGPDEAGAGAATPQAPPTTTLDDDIDDILGTDRGARSSDAPPPDFGI